MLDHRIARSIACVLAVSPLCWPSPARAAGFWLPEASTAGLGTANAMVANPHETGAFAYNPAAMGFHDASSLSVGTALIGPSFSVETATGKHDSQGAEWLVTPLFQGMFKLSQAWRLGLGLTVPFGLETHWRDGTFPALSGTLTLPVPPPLTPNVPRGNHPTISELEILDFSPTAIHRITDDLSLSGGFDIYWARTAQLNSTAGQLSGDGVGLGFNLGALYRQGSWSLGTAFRSASTLGLEGDYQPLSQTLVALKRLAPAQSAELDVGLPWRLQLGARYAFNDRLAVEFDLARTGWSEFKALKVEGKKTGALIFSDTNDWDDANAYRLGMTYQWRPETQLRLGYSYDETGQGDDSFSARIPDNDRHLFSVGLAQMLGHGYSLEAGYMYVVSQHRDYRGGIRYTAGSALNGSDALNGDYAMDAHLIGLDLVKVF
jgi:long-chain fatty acid transport protein